ncbi:hypothetical protein RvY_09713 [Ramazzottius varieornatus]|uniref:Yip1 domain-containing protein n=1 Tax=Ramazzottius varieornatus TaxID=947166 RepID=A0A1D1VAD8_RAMVA|nr:hypothetical protein RvY_09713 [Ramazzottius varieornatus]
MENNPFKPSAFESKSTTINVPQNFDFYPSSTSYASSANANAGGSFGASNPPAQQSGFGFDSSALPGNPLDAVVPPEASAVLNHPVWTWKFWQSFFDVDTTEVLRRIFLSFAPWPRYLKSESVDVFIGAKPDLYGPFWISSTLVFVIAVLGNLASYFQNYGECFKWHYDFHKVTAAAISIFLYVWILPICIWTFLWWRNSHGSLKLSGALCLYGYSMFLYIPVSFLWLIHIVWLQWLFALTAATLSGIILAYVFWNHLHFNHSAMAVLTAIVVFLLHLCLGFGFVAYFFHYPPPSEDCIIPGTNGTSTIQGFATPVVANMTDLPHSEAYVEPPNSSALPLIGLTSAITSTTLRPASSMVAHVVSTSTSSSLPSSTQENKSGHSTVSRSLSTSTATVELSSVKSRASKNETVLAVKAHQSPADVDDFERKAVSSVVGVGSDV